MAHHAPASGCNLLSAGVARRQRAPGSLEGRVSSQAGARPRDLPTHLAGIYLRAACRSLAAVFVHPQGAS